jgi:hypothetical protein
LFYENKIKRKLNNNYMTITKKEVLENIEKVREYVAEIDNKKEEVVKGLEIKNRWTGEVKFISTKTTYCEACEDNKANLYEANLSGADLRGADLSGANLSGADLREADPSGANLYEAELMDSKFTGKGGNTKIKKSGLDNFLKALGIIVEN